jgi:hypothetical protein
MTESEVAIFCRQVRKRSEENRKALALLHNRALTGQIMGILRQELDSMVRCMYILSVTEQPYREKLIHASVNGIAWRTKDDKCKVTDRDMVDLSSKLHGWAKSVYAFGCGFIHLSSFHDYSDRDPFDSIAPEERRDIARHLNYYHGVPMDRDVRLRDIEPVLPAVFEKISANLECYVKSIEMGGDLSD